MIRIILIILFLTPLIFINFSYLLIQFIYIFMYIFFLSSGCNSYLGKISYFFGVDIYSYGLILIIIIISSYIIMSIINSRNLIMFMFINLLIREFLLFIFGSLNFLYIYISFEFVLFPLLILILGWGYQPERLIAGIYLLFYTVFLSLPLFILILWLFYNLGSLFFDIMKLNTNFFLTYFIIVIVFIVKLPMCFVHFWLPKAHVQAPVSGSIILAGLILKIGGYGLIRIVYIVESIFVKYSFIWYSLCIVGSLIISIICLLQADIKCLIALSSVSHMGIVIIGLITTRSWGLIGSYLLILGHGFCSSGIFYMANIFYIRTLSRRFFINKGFLFYLPRCSIIWFILCIFNIGCPPRINFLRELIILRRIISFWVSSLYFFALTSFFCACFSYYLYRYRQHGLFQNLYRFSVTNLVEFINLLIHLVPLFVIPLILIIFFYLSSLIKI